MAERKVLFVDDDPDDLQLVEEVLEDLNWPSAIVKAYNGQEALEQLNYMYRDGGLPCLVVLDINMPVLDGKKTLAIIKQTLEYKKLPVVIFTTSINPDDRAFCEGMGVEMVSKPTNFNDLKRIVERLLNQCRT